LEWLVVYCSPTMKYIQLGRTDLNVSRLCFGCWQLSPNFWGNISHEDWKKAVNRSLDLGINFIDTADAYGDGDGETLLGDYLKEQKLRDKFIIATKFYWNFTGKPKPRHPDTSHDYILRACEASLRRLKTDVIDLYQIHSWDPLTRPEEVAAALLRLRKEGKVRWFGVSNLNADQMRMYLQYFDFDCLQPNYSLLVREPEAREFPLCLEKRIGVIAYSPLFRGLLSGKYVTEQKFTDTREHNPYFKGEAFKEIVKGLELLKPIAARLDLTLAQLAIRWILSHPAITSAIMGVKTADNIESVVKATEANLSIPDWHEVAGIMAAAKKAASSAT
jgi:aryl-alcohol dehydrogenase-like predicted oxidoreductase